jgi:hypothetical protein
MVHYSPWPVNIKGGFLGIDYNGDVYMLADGRLIMQSGGGLTFSSTSDIIMNGGSITMTGGAINLDSGDNYIHISPTLMEFNAANMLMKQGNVYATSGGDGYTFYFTTESGEEASETNGGAGFCTFRLAANKYMWYTGSIDSEGWNGYVVSSPGYVTGLGETIPPYMVISCKGDISILPGTGGVLHLGFDNDGEVQIGGYQVWSDNYYHCSAASLPKVASANIRNSHNTEVSISTDPNGMHKCKTITFTDGLKGAVRVYNVVKTINGGASAADIWSKVYKNGVAFGTQRFNQTPAGQTQTYSHNEDLTVDMKPGETLELWANAPAVTGSASYQEEFYVCYDNGDITTAISSNTSP